MQPSCPNLPAPRPQRAAGRALRAGLTALACGAGLLWGGIAMAQNAGGVAVAAVPPQYDPAPVVVELFTAQGCSACPPADDFFGQLAVREDVLALALHVDYWDYIGWPDPFAQPAFTDRQRDYALAAGHNTIYTPQMVVAGQHRIEGYRTMQIMDMIGRHRSAIPAVRVLLERRDGRLWITATADPPLGRSAMVQVVRYDPSRRVDISAGENAGRSVVYHNVVTHWDRVADWDGSAPFALDLPIEGDAPVAVIVQEPDAGAVLGAARLR